MYVCVYVQSTGNFFLFLCYTYHFPCPCRQSASCTHVSALLHALASLCLTPFPTQDNDTVDEEEVVPITSLACQWKPPRKRKESAMKITDVEFQKHVYGRTKRRTMKSIEGFDPRPGNYCGTANTNLPALLDSVRGQGLCLSPCFLTQQPDIGVRSRLVQ